MTRFHVSLSWRTATGTIASAAFLIVAQDESDAMSRACAKIRRDARRRYEGRLKARAVPIH